MPLGLFKLRSLSVSNVIAVLWAAGMFGWFFLCALYLQLVLGFDPMQVGLSFLPGSLIMGTFSLGLSAWIVNRFGVRRPLAFGLSLAALALLWLSRAPVDGMYFIDVFPSMVLLGLGAGTAFNPIFLSAMSQAKPEDSGLASGIVNTSFMMGGALGLAILASVAAARTNELLAGGAVQSVALVGGYHVAFLTSASFVALAALLGAFALGKVSMSPEGQAPVGH
jgi:predicted MFS family arabinose efflux permease